MIAEALGLADKVTSCIVFSVAIVSWTAYQIAKVNTRGRR